MSNNPQPTPAMTSADVRELEPCPFCGGEAFIRHVEAHDHTPALKLVIPDLDAAEDTYWPECLTCGAAKDGKNTEAEAVAAWNTRHSTPAPVNVDRVEAAAWAMAEVIAKRHGGNHTAQDWMGDERRAEARAALEAAAPVNVDQLREALEVLLAEARERGGGLTTGERLGCAALKGPEAA